jgi:Glycosyltransferase family 87
MSGKYRIIRVIAFWLLAVLFVIFVFLPSVNKINTDFPNYYVSSNMLLDGKDLKDAYDNIEFNRQLLLYGIQGQIVSFVPYPPVNALLMLPVARLSPLDAKLVWNFLSSLLLITCIYVLTKLVQVDFYSIGIIFFLSGYALANNFLFGQAYLLMLFCLLLSVYFMKQDKDILSAFFISLSIVLKFYTIFFLFLFIFKKRFKLLFWCIAFCILLYIPVVLITGLDLNYFYFSKLMPRLGDGWVGTVYAVEYQSFFSLLHRLFHFEPSLNPNPLVQNNVAFYFFKYMWIFGLLSVSLAYVQKGEENLKLEVSLFCIIALLLLPLNASYQYVVLIPAVIFMGEYFLKQKKYLVLGVIVFVMASINSPLQVWAVNQAKNTSFFILGYAKLMGLLYLWIVNLRVLGKETGFKPFNPRMRKLLYIGGIHVFFLTILSGVVNQSETDNAVPLVKSMNFLVTNPSALNTQPEKFIYTECINEKFVLRSNFGLSIDNESIFYPRMVNEYMLEYETVENCKAVKKIIDLATGEYVLTNPSKRVTPEISKSGKWQCYVESGQVIIEELRTGIKTQLTRGKQFCSLPVFAENDTKIIFSSDRNRGVGFSTLYEIPMITK